MITPKNKKSVDYINSRYVQGGKTYIDDDNNMGWWERSIIEHSTDDIIFTIPLGFQGRPDLISNYFYGKASLFWLVMQYNNIVDPDIELVEGKELRLPSTDRVMVSILNKNTGGVKVKK